MSNNNDDCAICGRSLYDQIYDSIETPGIHSGCNHTFHEGCVDKLVHNAKDGSFIPCPVCKKNLVPPNMRQKKKYILSGKTYDTILSSSNKGGKTKTKRKSKSRKTKSRKTKSRKSKSRKTKSRKTGVKRKKY